MAASRRDLIVAAAITALNTGAPVGVPTFSRVRTRMLANADLPAGSVYPVKEDVEKLGGRWSGIVQRRLELSVECWGTVDTTPGPASLDAAVDVLVQWVTKALVGNQLGGLVLATEELETSWQYTQGENASVLAQVKLQVNYRTAEADQTLSG